MPRNTGLPERAGRLLATWKREGQRALSIEDVRRAVGERAGDVVRHLAAKGALQRVQRGVYRPQPAHAPDKALLSAPLLASAVMAGQPHYLGGPWALSFHDFPEGGDSRIDVFSRSRLRPRRLGGDPVYFHLVEADRLKYGILEAKLEGMEIFVSDLERTVLDCLDSPRICGPIDDSVAFLKETLEVLDHRKLIDYAVRGSRPSTCQRLGVLLERIDVTDPHMRRLLSRASETRALTSLMPGNGRRGQCNGKWHVVEND